MTDPNVPAFPHHEVWDNEKTDVGWIGGGLTKREYFAAMAMQGYMSKARGDEMLKDIAVTCVAMADALILELNKPAPMTEAEKKGLAY